MLYLRYKNWFNENLITLLHPKLGFILDECYILVNSVCIYTQIHLHTHSVNELNLDSAFDQSLDIQTLSCRHISSSHRKRASLTRINLLEKDEAGHDNSYFSAKKEVNFVLLYAPFFVDGNALFSFYHLM